MNLNQTINSQQLGTAVLLAVLIYIYPIVIFIEFVGVSFGEMMSPDSPNTVVYYYLITNFIPNITLLISSYFFGIVHFSKKRYLQAQFSLLFFLLVKLILSASVIIFYMLGARSGSLLNYLHDLSLYFALIYFFRHQYLAFKQNPNQTTQSTLPNQVSQPTNPSLSGQSDSTPQAI